jgi:hypothetical protein
MPRRIGRRLAGLPPFVILATAWLAGIVYAFPGLMTMDSIDQLNEARAHFYTDGHPAAMAAMWRIVDAIVPGPFGMLVIQTVAFIAGLYLILRHAMRPRRAAVVTALLYVFPPVLAPMAVIWKDCIMAGFFVLGAAALLARCRWIRVLGLVSLAVATSVRYNAPAATLPLVVLLFRWSDAAITTWKQRIARYAIATAAWVAITIIPFAFDAAITDRKMYVWHSSLAVLDIAGTLAEVDGTISDDELQRVLAGTELRFDHDIHAQIRKVYVSWDFAPLIYGEGHLWSLPIQGTTPAPEPQREAISRAFWQVIADHPGAYLRHRWSAFVEAIGLASPNHGSMVMMAKFQYPKIMGDIGLATNASRLQTFWQRKINDLSKATPLFRPWIYLLISLILLPLCRRHRDVFALLVSGIVFELTLFPLAPTPDYRYSHWMVVCTYLAIIMLTARRAAAARVPVATDAATATPAEAPP